ncbi:hypothetical protein [Dokdonia sp.]|uniref:hypothetical protein n=1 Tax=Dokdonia sp. TaxID=2024995 RepID=UPI003264682D
MIEPIPLSKTNSGLANSVFNDTLDSTNVPATLILVIGDTTQSNTAVKTLTSLINSDDHFYKGVRVVQAPNIDFILDTLKGLNVSPRLKTIKWNSINSYLIFSITNVFNNIGNVVLASKFDNQPKRYIDTSIMLALAFDKNLNA